MLMTLLVCWILQYTALMTASHNPCIAASENEQVPRMNGLARFTKRDELVLVLHDCHAACSEDRGEVERIASA